MPEENYLTRSEHNEFAKRIDEENHRQNKRIDELEVMVKSFAGLPDTVKRIEKIVEDIKNKPEERMNTAKQTVINTICSTLSQAAIFGFLALIIYGLMQ